MSETIVLPITEVNPTDINTEDGGFVKTFRCDKMDLDNSESDYDDPWFFTVDLIDVGDNHEYHNIIPYFNQSL